MYVVFGDRVVDSNDIKKLIEENSDFIIEEDMSLRSKREDIVAFNMSIKINILDEILEDDGYELEDEDKEEIFNEYMDLSDTMAVELEEFMPEDSISMAYSYRYDEVESKIKIVFAMAHEEMGDLKLNDIIKRLLTLVA